MYGLVSVRRFLVTAKKTTISFSASLMENENLASDNHISPVGHLNIICGLKNVSREPLLLQESYFSPRGQGQIELLIQVPAGSFVLRFAFIILSRNPSSSGSHDDRVKNMRNRKLNPVKRSQEPQLTVFLSHKYQSTPGSSRFFEGEKN